MPLPMDTDAVREDNVCLLQKLPSHLLQSMLMQCGKHAGGAVLACKALARAWQEALAQPHLTSQYLIASFTPSKAAHHAYGPVSKATFKARVASGLWPSPTEGDDEAQLALLKALEGAGAEIRSQVPHLLWEAASTSHVSTIRWLLDPKLPHSAGASPRHPNCAAALLAAATAGCLPICSALLCHRVSPNTRNGEALFAAVQQGHVHVVDLLLWRGAKPRAQRSRCLLHAASAGHEQLVSMLLAAGANPAAQNGKALVDAAAHRHVAVVRALLEAGAPVDACYGAPLCAASEVGNMEMVQLLLSHGARPNSKALTQAVLAGNEELLSVLLLARTQPFSSEMCDPLKKAASRGTLSMVQKLRAAGAKPTESGSLALQLAVEGGHEHVARALLAAGADPMASYGQLLLVAARKGSSGTVAALLEAGVPVGAFNHTALQDASRLGHVAVVRVLLAAGADPRVNGSLALADASHRGHVAVVAELLAAGADPRARGGWAVKSAEFAGQWGLAEMLREAAEHLDEEEGRGEVAAGSREGVGGGVEVTGEEAEDLTRCAEEFRANRQQRKVGRWVAAVEWLKGLVGALRGLTMRSEK